MPNLLLSDGAQWDRYNELAFNRSAEREMRVREMAQIAIQSDETYRITGLLFPYIRSPKFFYPESGADLNTYVPYDIITVRLCPSLRNAPEAVLIAEEIIRNQMDGLDD